MSEAYITKSPYLVGRVLHFSAAPNNPDVNMYSICKRCDLESYCFGYAAPSFKKAHINLNDPKIEKITRDTSNCGIILDIVARKSEVQNGFFPKLGYSAT